MPKLTASHSYLNLEMLQVPLVKTTPLLLQHVLLWLVHKTRVSSQLRLFRSSLLTLGLKFRQSFHLSLGLIFTFPQLIGYHHWEGGPKPQDPICRLLHRAEWRKQSSVSPSGKPGSSILPTNMTNVVIVKEGWLHKRGKKQQQTKQVFSYIYRITM